MDGVTFCEIEPNYCLDESEKAGLHDVLSSVVADPYRQYSSFMYQVRKLIEEKKVPDNVVDVIKDHANGNLLKNPIIFIRNMPIDEEVPLFDNNRQVQSKYELKKKFVAEACLSMIAQLSNQTPIGYLNVNGGDVFQDIYPVKHMSDTQSQKAIGPIYFHKDLANHYVRPDFVNMLSMRSSSRNEIYTTFVKNLDIFSKLTADEIEEYRKVQFFTPFDDLTVLGGGYDVGEANQHPIISGDHDIRFFENRTIGTNERANELVAKLCKLLHASKKRVQMLPGDFIGVENNLTVHGKEVGQLHVPDEAWSRWTIKTVNVLDIVPHRSHLMAGSDYVVAG